MKISLSYLGVFSCALAGLSLGLVLNNLELRADLEAARAELSVLQKMRMTDSVAAVSETAAGKSTPPKLDLGPESPPANSSAPQSTEVWANLRRQYADPAFRAERLKEARTRVEMRHGRLFQRLGVLSPSQAEALVTAMAEMEVNRLLGGAPVRPNEGEKEILQRLALVESDAQRSEQEIARILGPESFERYRAYQESFPYREKVESIANGMRARGLMLSDEQQEKLIDAYTAAIRQATEDASAAGGGRGGNISSAHAPLDRFDQRLAETLSKVLDPAALKFFMDAQFAQERHPL